MKLTIDQEVYDKVMHWVNKASFEVSGFGKVLHDKQTNTFRVIDAYLLKQEGQAAETELDDAALARLMFQTKDEEGELKWWWHSHVNMGVFWSGTDVSTIKSLGQHGWITATVFNKKWEMKSAVCYKYQSELNAEGVQMEADIPTKVQRYLPDGATEAWDKEFDDNVTEKKYLYGGTRSGSLPAGGSTFWSSGMEWSNIHQCYMPKENKSLIGSSVGNSSKNTGVFNIEDPGMYGYGIQTEARVYGVTPREYWDLLEEGDQRVMKAICEKLDEYEDSMGYNQYGRSGWSGHM